MKYLVGILMFSVVGGCDGDAPTDATDASTDVPPPEQTPCEVLRMPQVPFDSGPETGAPRGGLAADFTIPTLGDPFSFSGSWTGCDSLIVHTQATMISGDDDRSVWRTGVAELLARSPQNARFVFVTQGLSDAAAAEERASLLQDIDATLGGLDAEAADWWSGRLVVSNVGAAQLQNWVGQLLISHRGEQGFAIDRMQRIRPLGSLLDVDAPDSSGLGQPYQARLHTLANELTQFNRDATRRADRLAGTEIVLLDGAVQSGTVEALVDLPDAGVMSGFDTVEIELQMLCQDRSVPELEGCKTTGQVGRLWLVDEDRGPMEVIRFITSYHREITLYGNTTHVLPWLNDGGQRRFRVSWAPDGSPEPSAIKITLRLLNRGLGRAPVETTLLWRGGPFDSSFNDGRERVVTMPEGTRHVGLVSVVSGHGDQRRGCASMCAHMHIVRLGSVQSSVTYGDGAGSNQCGKSVWKDGTPNQWGPWWLQRAGWCAGTALSINESPITENLPVGEAVVLDYSVTVEGQEPQDDYGTMLM
ncbi:MAG: hypothetical protein ACI9MC_002384, partial [Kiritimatiellia bacterium]